MISKILKAGRFFVEYSIDLWRFVRFNNYSPLVPKATRQFYKILIETHTIEKGLSLADRRHLFGKDKIRFVMRELEEYDASLSPLPVEMAMGALSAYLEFHEKDRVSDPLLEEIRSFQAAYRARQPFVERGGVREMTLPRRGPAHELHLLLSRASLRMQDPAPLQLEEITKLIEAAQSAPSQCNRQATKIHVYQDRAQIDTLLSLQGGSRGFSHCVGNLLVVTFDISAWGGAGQRNQGYVDGALFAMYVLLAAHGLDLAACPLNLAVTNARENEIRSAGNIPANERLVVMVAVGRPLEEPLRVAASPRRRVSEVMFVHQKGG